MREWLARLRDWLRRDTRARWSIPWLEHVQQDVRYALRGLRRSPAFTATVVITLGLGIGANAAMFGVIDNLMFRPFPYLRDPSLVHHVYLRSQNQGSVRTRWDTEYPTYLALTRETSSFAQIAAFTHRVMATGVGEASRERPVAAVSASYFSFFDARPRLGRFFTVAEDTPPRGANVAVLGYDFWTAELGGRDVLGEVLQVGSVRATIIGVAPQGFAGVNEREAPAVFLPITTFAATQPNARNAAEYFRSYSWRFLEVLVRRKPDVSTAQASADLTQAYVKSWNVERSMDASLPPSAIAAPHAVAGALRLGAGPDPSLEARTALWVSGVAVIVLLIASANVANLFLARALTRAPETALRLALGVSRWRLASQALAESLTVSVLGGVAGLLVAQWGGVAVRGLLGVGMQPRAQVFTDQRTLVVAFVMTLSVGLLTGLAPALLSGNRHDLVRALKASARDGGGATHHRSRTRGALLVMQSALSVVLLIGAGLFVQSLDRVQSIPMGYDADHVVVANRNMRGVRLSDSALVVLQRTLLATAQGVPGVEHAAWVMAVPFWITNSTRVFIPGIDSVERFGQITYQAATSDYFPIMRTRILRGRGLSSEDRANTPGVAVVSASMATTLWPDKDAIGQCMRVFAESLPCYTVVGIAEDIAQDDLQATRRLHYYLSLEQFRQGGSATMVLRTRGDPAALQETIRKRLQGAMPGESYITVGLLRDRIDTAQRSWRVGATMFVAFGALALVVAAVGLYGVIGYNVAQRMHELGVRVALGAKTLDVVRLVAGQGLRFGLAGIALGVVLALVAARWMQPLLFRQSATDPFTYVVAAVVLLVVALLASLVPALRASRADPSAALRSN